jgi:hypothetical protein
MHTASSIFQQQWIHSSGIVPTKRWRVTRRCWPIPIILSTYVISITGGPNNNNNKSASTAGCHPQMRMRAPPVPSDPLFFLHKQHGVACHCLPTLWQRHFIASRCLSNHNNWAAPANPNLILLRIWWSDLSCPLDNMHAVSNNHGCLLCFSSPLGWLTDYCDVCFCHKQTRCSERRKMDGERKVLSVFSGRDLVFSAVEDVLGAFHTY